MEVGVVLTGICLSVDTGRGHACPQTHRSLSFFHHSAHARYTAIATKRQAVKFTTRKKNSAQ